MNKCEQNNCAICRYIYMQVVIACICMYLFYKQVFYIIHKKPKNVLTNIKKLCYNINCM